MSKVKEKTVIKELARANVLSMKPYSSARDEFKDFNTEMVYLDANENPFNTKVNRYPDPQQRQLKQLLAKQKNRREEELLLGNGSDEVLDLIFRVFCEPGKDRVITLPPSYGMYKVLCETNDVECLEVPLSKDFQPDVPRILDAQTPDTKLLFICSPNNPSGNLIDIKRVGELLDGFKGIVVVDEAYIDFTEGSSCLEYLDSYNNLIVTQTLSKAYGMAGIRLGICYASSEIIALLNKIKPPYNVNTLTQQYAYEQLNNVEAYRRRLKSVISERTRLFRELGRISFVKRVFESDANFILIRVDDADLRYRQLIDQGIVVRNRSSQLHCENTLRITVGTPEENDLLLKTTKAL